MNVWKLLLLTVFVVGVGAAEELRDERNWQGLNGKTLRGRYHSISADGMKVEILTTDGVVRSVGIGNLIEADQQFIRNGGKPREVVKGPVPKEGREEEVMRGDPSKFKPEATPVRGMILLPDPAAHGYGIRNSEAEAMWIAMSWWDLAEVVKLPQVGDLGRRSKWLTKVVTRDFPESRSPDAIVEFLNGLYAKTATFRVFVENSDLSRERLATFASGPNVVIMWVQHSSGKTKLAILESISENGQFAMRIDGKRLTGMAKSKDYEMRRRLGLLMECTFTVSNSQEISRSLPKGPPEFSTSSGGGLQCMVFKPYVYLTADDVSTPPPDATFPVDRLTEWKRENPPSASPGPPVGK